jgi:hypothetical protein
MPVLTRLTAAVLLASTLIAAPGPAAPVSAGVKLSPKVGRPPTLPLTVQGRGFGTNEGLSSATQGIGEPTAGPFNRPTLWVSLVAQGDFPTALGVSPDGSAVYVTGFSGFGTAGKYVTVAERSDTGAPIWLAEYGGGFAGGSVAEDLAVSPDGALIFVTGGASFGPTGKDYATVAYDAVTGVQVWEARYEGPGNSNDTAYAIALSPDGDRVFVTGSSVGVGTAEDVATVAYDAATGTQLWVSTYSSPGAAEDDGFDIAVAPDGSRVFVVGGAPTLGVERDIVTIAYDSATGAQQWLRMYTSAHKQAQAGRIAVSADGSIVYIAGYRGSGGQTQDDILTIAYEADTGAQRWLALYDGAAHGNDYASALLVSPDGTRVYVTGASDGANGTVAAATVSYDGVTGIQVWSSRYAHSGVVQDGGGLAIDSSGARLYLTSSASDDLLYDIVTLSYDAAAGALRWAARYDGPIHGQDLADTIGLSPNGRSVFVAGVTGTENGQDYVTLAYKS